MNKSIADQARSASRWLGAIALSLACQPETHARYPAISVSAQSIEYGNVEVSQMRASLDSDGRFTLQVASAAVEGLADPLEKLELNGVLQELETRDGRALVRSSLQSGRFSGSLELHVAEQGASGTLLLDRRELVDFADLAFLPPEFGWLSSGYLDLALNAEFDSNGAGEARLGIEFGKVAFDSPDGRFAGDGLAVEVDVTAQSGAWFSPRVSGSIDSGELLIDDFYRNFSDGGLEFSLAADTGKDRWVINELRLHDDHSLNMAGRATIDLQDGPEVTGVEVNRLELSFPGAYGRYLEPVLAPWTLNGLQVTGRLSWDGTWADGAFQSGDLEIEDLSVVDIERGRFAMTGLDTRLRPGDHSFDSRLEWRGLLVGKLNLGSGEAALDSEPGAVAIVKPVQLGVLGGTLNLHELKVLLPGGGSEGKGEPDIRLRLDLQDLDMEQLTAAFGWPSFTGRVSGSIPGVHLENGVLEVDGEIRVNVFDGLISMDRLRVERPFGVLPSLAANVEAQNLDLQLLTSTFSFGRISGRIDGYMRDLRMLDWRPVAFDAWLGTPARQQGSKGISRQAVNHLTTLGGGSATTALTSPVMKMFNNFSYKRLGFGCRMQNNICEVRGISEDDVSVLIMEGAGVPKVTIRAFNRTVDWPQLLAHLAAAADGDDVRIGD